MPALDHATFSHDVFGSFPPPARSLAKDSLRVLLPFVDLSYHHRSFATVTVAPNYRVRIPQRISFVGLSVDKLPDEICSSPTTYCLLTRSTDGYLRQAALRQIIALTEAWVIPYVVLLAGEYVVEIIEDIVASVPVLDKNAYIAFVLENRPIMRLLRSKAASYWDVYYRYPYPKRNDYPGLMFLNELDRWANPC